MSEKVSRTSADDVIVTSPVPAAIDDEGHVDGTNQPPNGLGSSPPKDFGSNGGRVHYEEAPEVGPRTWYGKLWKVFKTPGSALQIVAAAIVAIAIGMAVNVTVDDVPQAAIVILGIPGRLWLRALTTVVLPLIITAMILAMQRLKEMAKTGSSLAKWSIIYYFCTTVFAIVHSILMTSLVWANIFVAVDDDQLTADPGGQAGDITTSGEDLSIPEVVQTVFDSFIPNNFVGALANNDLLAVLVCSVVIGWLIIGPSSRSPLLALVKEIDRIITIIITFLIKLAPIAVFFLILSNIMRLDLASVGQNLGVLIGAAISSFAIHLFIVFPIIFYTVTRINPYTYWISGSPAWITAWGTASSAATLPVTMRVVRKQGVPPVVAKFTVPLGCLVNMDGTAIYFPIVVTFMAATQGISLGAGDYIIVLLLSTLASIGTTPIPSSSLVLTVMICGTVNVPITGMYAVVVAIDWFLDRFRTALNISSDLFAAKIVTVLARVEESEAEAGGYDEDQMVQDAVEEYNREVRGDRL